MRYYAEWLDGEYTLLNQAIRGYDHSRVMQLSMRFHALFGSTVVLSDAQLIDFRTPLPILFLDRKFRAFLKENPAFLALVANPVRGQKDQKFAIAMKGIERLIDQANKPADSYEMAVTQMGEPILRVGRFDADEYLNSKNRRSGQVGRVMRRFSQYRRELLGLLHAVDHFSAGPLPDTTMASTGPSEQYDNLLSKLKSNSHLISEAQANRIDEILKTREQRLPPAEWGRRAAIRKVLGTGKWHHETWTPRNLRLYLDVVHAWNSAINRAIAPEGGTMYESRDDLPLSRYERSVSDSVGWFRAGRMPTTGVSNRILRFLSWDPMSTDWDGIASFVRLTQASARELQACLKTGNAGDRAEALTAHASHIADCLDEVRTLRVPEWVWWVSRVLAKVKGVPSQSVDAAKVALQEGPYAYASLKRRLVVNTFARAGSELL